MIYVHVPFCKSFCIYCDFYSESACKDSKFEAFTKCICAEALNRRDEILDTLSTNTLYIGGGTPSVMPLPFFEKLLSVLPVKEFDEFTVEVNPDDIVHRGSDFLQALRRLGANRISMGVQSFDDSILRWMRRRHDARTAENAFRLLRDNGFDNISLDVIFGIQDLSMAILNSTLDKLVSLGPEHISAYQLMIEEGSELESLMSEGKYEPLPDELCEAQYYHICKRLRDAGYMHYEISNWARPGFEAQHNSAYWSRQPYVGLGPGAHSLMISTDKQVRSWNSRQLCDWTSACEILNPAEIREERIMLGLRRAGGTVIDGRSVQIPESKWFVADTIIEDLI